MQGRPLVPIAAVGFLLIIFFSAVMIRPRVPEPIAIIAGAVQEHFEHIQSPTSTLGIVSDNPAEILQWIDAKTGMHIKIPDHPLTSSVVGACSENGSHGNITCVFFDYDARRISKSTPTDSITHIPACKPSFA